MIENGCCLIHFGVCRTFGGDLGGGGGGGGGEADVQRQLDGVVRNKLIYQRIATALRVRSYVEAVCPEDENLVQKYKKVISTHDP